MSVVARAVATFGYVGLLRPAPGTWGSAAALALAWAVHGTAGFWGLLAAAAALSAAGFWACGRAVSPGDDPAEVVIDEAAGQTVALLFPAAAFRAAEVAGPMPWPAWAAAFLLFRLFDIWKPGPVGWADRRPGVEGVMLDDLIAGALAGCGVLLLGAAWHLPLILRS